MKAFLVPFVSVSLVLGGGAAAASWGSDCGEGTIEVNFARFHSAEFAGRWAVAPQATSPETARAGRIFCVLAGSQFDSIARIRKRTDRLYFVFNNMPALSPQDAETSFVGIEVRGRSDSRRPQLSMRREGDSWLERDIDRRYVGRSFHEDGERLRSVVQAHNPTRIAAAGGLPSVDGGATETEFAARVKASVHGAVEPQPNAPPKQTWEVREKMDYLRSLDREEAGGPNSVTAVWISFDQRPTPAFKAARRVVTGVRVGDAAEADVHMFGSNGEIPEFRYKILFFK